MGEGQLQRVPVLHRIRCTGAADAKPDIPSITISPSVPVTKTVIMGMPEVTGVSGDTTLVGECRSPTSDPIRLVDYRSIAPSPSFLRRSFMRATVRPVREGVNAAYRLATCKPRDSTGNELAYTTVNQAQPAAEATCEPHPHNTGVVGNPPG